MHSAMDPQEIMTDKVHVGYSYVLHDVAVEVSIVSTTVLPFTRQAQEEG